MAEQTLLERATVIRDEQEEALNTAHRVGSTIVLAAQEIARRVTDIRATSSDVSAWLHLSYIDEDGTPREVRIERLIAREGVTRDYAEARIDAQKPNEWFAKHCSYVLDNGGTLADFQRRCHQLIQEVLS